MAIPGGALRFQDSCEEAGERQHTASLKSFAPKLLTICVILCATSFAGCARNPAQREASPTLTLHEGKASPVRAPVRTRRYSEPYRYAEPKIRRPDLALLSPQPAPDCEFKRSDLKTVDPDEWGRLKVEYERQCYLDAEKTARERLALLQASSTCEIEPVRQRRPVR
ncbi:MAG TPA: hypothetical protein VMT72_03690 [Pseudolabrys sp.]|nr:hypothetical protein [Pseudolabrys sp.]